VLFGDTSISTFWMLARFEPALKSESRSFGVPCRLLRRKGLSILPNKRLKAAVTGNQAIHLRGMSSTRT